ncbi:PLP-dependent aminotransferase family protein [Chitinophaga qingshengii]|uniref:PLP-dependent aminotransferase family protein n=1 Tax=Chitinophaga qingshengii TaxID=1569794 RepID=A0ABR7TKC1_9BACT|nr:PLP-dependent aminotransferase family protein [Chitinophaga qingshengii]MBC9929937.1 PLP-dependent aminotransferase family protein [Chitinophaga qingshengii]
MLPYKTLITIDRDARLPVYQQIANRFAGLIREGVLKPGLLLPGSRVLALQLGLHRKTVVAAYDELVSQDWATAIPRKGVMVATNLPDIKPRSFQSPVSPYGNGPTFSFGSVPFVNIARHDSAKAGLLIINDGFADMREAPLEAWMKESRAIIRRPRYHQLLTYGSAMGSMRLRQELVRYLTGTRGLTLSLDNVMTTRGAQMAIYLTAAMLIKKGDYVIVGSPDYFFADLCFEQLGARLLRVPVDADGIDVEAVGQLCRTHKVRMLYVIPHHHHPTTVTLSAERRMRLLDIIRTHRLAVLEDDYDYDYHYSSAPILPLASGDHGGNVIYIGSFTKLLGLSIRSGFIVAPAAFLEQVSRLRKLMDLQGDNLSEETLAALLADGTIDRHLKKSHKLYHERRDQLTQLLQARLHNRVQFTEPAGGMATWVSFRKKYPLKQVAVSAAAMGLSMSNGSQYSHGTKGVNAIRFGFASLNNRELAKAVGILEKVLA